ncbi:fatty acid-binding protein, liver [Lingula anatina]|uniref:Fatty acid-binding protein, liver n=1 Tax=Lingula anatina TaxID=7574 RepID=A0A1S3J5Y9_LINAN|nr:fatty acid-binding protein, liver [Lingula anatina]|eukprot:XP_013405723.1 fatty acid-binding protein, liver [Lingula anatina]
MSKLVGKWKFESSEGWEEYMKGLDVGFALRKIGGMTKPQEEISIDGDFWQLDILSTFKNIHLKFKLGVAFEEHTVDGRTVQSTFTVEDDKLVHVQRGKPADSIITRELENDGTLKVTFKVVGKEEATCIRKFKRIES